MATPQFLFAVVTLLSHLIDAETKSSLNFDVTCVTDIKKHVVCTSDQDVILNKGFTGSNDTITSITLKECRITEIDEESFRIFSSLKYLDLSRNKLSTLKVNVFNELTELVHLNLSHNVISELPLLIFSNVTNMQILDLRNNNLKVLKQEIFVRNQNLKYIDLAYNNLRGETLEPLIFPVNSDIRHLDLSGNDLAVLHSDAFRWAERLEVLHLDACSLTEIPDLARPNLRTIKHLSMAGNKLTILVNEDTFEHLNNLEIIDLSDNDIDLINERLFHYPENLKTIILRNNKLKYLFGDTFRELHSLKNIDLSYNMFDEFPVDMLRWSSELKNLNLAGNRITYLPAHFISELRSVLVNLEMFYFHDNPWQCACLNDVLAEVKNNGIKYNSETFTGRKPVCVTHEIYYSCERTKSSIASITQAYDKLIHDYNKMNNVTM